MDITVKKRETNNKDNYTKDDITLAYEFAKHAHLEFRDLVKSVILFGSTAKKTQNLKSDVDIYLVIIDDISIYLTREVIHTYNIMTQNIVNKVSKKLHVNTMRLSSFWEYCRNGDPIIINMLRDGIALLDSHLFDPMQLLLKQGRIRPTKESIWNYFSRSPTTLNNSKWHILQAVIDLYWAAVDAAHAALMKAGNVPPSPDHVSMMLEKTFVDKKLLDKKYVATMNRLYRTMKMITHREIKDIPGKDYDHLYKECEQFVAKMKTLIEK